MIHSYALYQNKYSVHITKAYHWHNDNAFCVCQSKNGFHQKSPNEKRPNEKSPNAKVLNNKKSK